MGIPGNEAAGVLAKQAAEGVPPDDHDNRMCRQWVKRRKRENVEEDDGMNKKSSYELL